MSFAAQQIRSYDYWWHLRTGALIAETGSVPSVDPYSYTVPGAAWVDVHWLFQLGLHSVHSLGGHEAVGLAKMALTALLLGLAVALPGLCNRSDSGRQTLGY